MKKKNKKKENNYKELFRGIIIISLLLLVLITYIVCYKYKKDDNKVDFSDKSNALIYVLNDMSFIKINDLSKDIDLTKTLGKYNCKYDDCDIYENNLFSPIYDSEYIVLKENNKVFVYNFKNSNIVSNLYDSIIYKKNNYFGVINNNKYGLIDINGYLYIDTLYDEIDYDNIYNNVLVKIMNNNLQGIYDIKNNAKIIDTVYDDIVITDNSHYAILKDDLWYVISKENEVLTNGYSYVYAFNKGFIALIDNELHILKYSKEEELLNDSVIPVTGEYSISSDTRSITITVTDSVYEYNINKNNLTLK